MYKKFCSSIILFIWGSFLCDILFAQQLNTLTSQEKQEGWQLLFNGKDLKGWHSYLEKETGQSMAGSERHDYA